MTERGELEPQYQTRVINPSEIIPGTYYAPEARGSFQVYGKDEHNVQINFDPATMKVTEIWVSRGWFVQSQRPISGDLKPKDMKVEVVLDEQTQEPTQVSLTYDPSDTGLRYDVAGRYLGQTLLDVIPFVEEGK